jgi:hypothetical protein
MNLKHILEEEMREPIKLFSVAITLVALLSAGCGKSSRSTEEPIAVPERVKSAQESENGETISTSFIVGKGLWVPEITRQALALRIVEVGERNITRQIRFPVQIYRVSKQPESRPATNRASALGMVSMDEADPLKPGQPVTVHGQDGTTADGQLVGVHKQLAKVAGFVEIQVEFEEPTNRYAPGAFLETVVMVETDEKVMSVPRSALLHTAEGDCVYVVSGKYLFRTPVEVGVKDSEFAEIKEGLYTGDQVVLEPVMSLWLAELAAVKGGQSCCLTKPTK